MDICEGLEANEFKITGECPNCNNEIDYQYIRCTNGNEFFMHVEYKCPFCKCSNAWYEDDM
jgi:hypothetical protein